MTRIAIVGGGRAATLHAETAMASPGVDLVGVGGRPGSASALSEATGAPDLALSELVERADGLIVAVSPDAAQSVVDSIPHHVSLLVESPIRVSMSDRPIMTAANLLHSPMVKKGLRAIAELGVVHHLTLRGRAIHRAHLSDVLSEPFSGVWPVLLAASGSPAVSVSATLSETGARASVTTQLEDGRSVTAEVEWVDPSIGSALTELEAASGTGVVNIGLWPSPTLEIDGRPISPADEHPMVALGFAEQMRRFAAVSEGRSDPWPPLSVGVGVTRLTAAAAASAALDGAQVEI